LVIASCTRALAQDADAADLFLEDGQWPTISGWTALAEKRLDQSRMADSLDQIARHGARALYDGDLGAAMARDVQDKGGCLSHDDLQAYRAEFSAPLDFAYRDARFHVVPGLTAGPTFRDTFASLATEDLGNVPGPDSYAAMAEALKGAYARRLGSMGDTGESPEAPGCTTHFSVVDRHGNMVAQTQTLLSIFGSRVVSPSTGSGPPELAGPEQALPDERLPGDRRTGRQTLCLRRFRRAQDFGRGGATVLLCHRF
jgi:gamma-glutamyltranspeptidase/glutathione hydrolase